MSDERFSIVQRVRFGDLDAMQHMNNVEFLRFFETARIDYIRQLLPDHSPGQPRTSSASSSPSATSTTARPRFYDDEIRTYVWITRDAAARRSRSTSR